MFLNPDKPFSIFSNKGKLSQCDNALTAALNSSLSLGMNSNEGTVLLSLKKLPKLAVKRDYHKVFNVCKSIGVTYSGLQPDFRIQLRIAQKICEDYFDIYRHYPCVDVFVHEFSLQMQKFSQTGGMRPFGTFLLFCGGIVDSSDIMANGTDNHNGTGNHNDTTNSLVPALYQIDPSGSFKKVNCSTAGIDYENVRSFIEKRRGVLDDNISTCCTAVNEFSGIEISAEDISIGVYEASSNEFKVYNYESIDEVVKA